MTEYQLEVINVAFDHPGLLDSWECDFISNLSLYRDTVELSDKETTKINEIGDKLQISR